MRNREHDALVTLVVAGLLAAAIVFIFACTLKKELRHPFKASFNDRFYYHKVGMKYGKNQ